MSRQRIIQGASLILFLLMLCLASYPMAERIRPDLFLRMDPLVLAGTLISGRVFISLLLPAATVAALTLVLGRFFCSMICPLGTSIDITDRALKKARRFFPGRIQSLHRLSYVKYVVLAFILGSGVAGFSLVLLFSPSSIATRFYGLFVYPVIARGIDLGLPALRDISGRFGVTLLEYASISTPAFYLQGFTITIALMIFAAGVLSPRFWCRYLCPAGAMLAVLSLRPFRKRTVSDACNDCGACRKVCPMDAIAEEDPRRSASTECIACEACARACPAGAVKFSMNVQGQSGGAAHFSTHRRALFVSGVTGFLAGLAVLILPGWIRTGKAGASGFPSSSIRPPGAVPEKDFLARCIRCGECMKACPTNTLQPTGISEGLAGFFSPSVNPVIGPCETTCARCGHVCPTGAVRTLSPEEKIWARIGSASVVKETCIAWEKGMRCLVCYEVCPFGAIRLEYAAESPVPVPFVDEKHCNGCGLCEFSCPVEGVRAILVSSRNALRMDTGSYIGRGRESGYGYDPRQPAALPEENSGLHAPVGPGELPPGFEE